MPATPPSPGPGSGDPRPLSERERHALSELEARTLDEDPTLGARMRSTEPGRRDRTSPRSYNALIQACIVFLLAVIVLPHAWAAGLLVLAGMVVPSAIALVAIRRAGR